MNSECSKGRFYVAPSALWDLPAGYLGRCPRLLHCAPLALIKTPARYIDESSMSLPSLWQEKIERRDVSHARLFSFITRCLLPLPAAATAISPAPQSSILLNLPTRSPVPCQLDQTQIRPLMEPTGSFAEKPRP